MASVKRVVIPYSPRGVFLPYHHRKERFSVIVAHRRAGKTVACVNDLIRAAWTCDKGDGRFAYLAPLHNQAKDVAWIYLKRYAAPLLASAPNETELRVDLLNGARIRLYGADNPDRLRGIYLDGCVLDEYADMHPQVWGEVVRPALADRQGWATFIGTPKGRNEFYNLYSRGRTAPDWMSLILRASETGILPKAELEAAALDMTPEQYDQEFECSFEAAIMGAYYGREMAAAEREGRLRAKVDRLASPIHCAWDLGNGANMAIWAFQVSPSGPIVHDFIQISGFYFEDYLKEIENRGYTGFDYVPHDIKAPSFETGRTRIETMVGHKRKPVLIADHKVDDGINAGKMLLPRAVFNSETCKTGLEALRQYRQEWDDRARVYKTTPKHDWASHPADAWRYLAMAYREHVEPAVPEPPKPVKGIGDYNVEEMWTFNKRPKDRV